jgi:hypothetical protein
MSIVKVIAEYNAALSLLKHDETEMNFKGLLTLCDDGKVIGVVSRFDDPESARALVGIHYKVSNRGTLSLARLDTRGIFGDVQNIGFAVLHGDYLPESSGSREFGGLHSNIQRQIPQPILKSLVYGPAISTCSIERFRDIFVADIENLLGNKKALFDGLLADTIEKDAVKYGQTAQLFLTPSAG